LTTSYGRNKKNGWSFAESECDFIKCGGMLRKPSLAGGDAPIQDQKFIYCLPRIAMD